MYFLAEGQEIKGRQSSVGNISQMWEIITPGRRLTRLREIPEFSIKLQEAPAKCGRVDSSGNNYTVFTMGGTVALRSVNNIFFPRATVLQRQNGMLVDGKAQLFYENILIYNLEILSIHGMFLLGIRETAPPCL